MIALEVVLLAIDVIDVDGYNTYMGQGMLLNIKNQIDFSGYVAAVEYAQDYPYLFPMGGDNGFAPKEFDYAYVRMYTDIMENYEQPVFLKDDMRSDILSLEKEIITIETEMSDAGIESMNIGDIEDEEETINLELKSLDDSDTIQWNLIDEAQTKYNDLDAEITGLYDNSTETDWGISDDGVDILIGDVADQVAVLNSEIDGLYNNIDNFIIPDEYVQLYDRLDILENTKFMVTNLTTVQENLREARGKYNDLITTYPNALNLEENLKEVRDRYNEDYIKYLEAISLTEVAYAVQWFRNNNFNDFGDSIDTEYDPVYVFVELPDPENGKLGYLYDYDEGTSFNPIENYTRNTGITDNFPWTTDLDAALQSDQFPAEPVYPEALIKYTETLPNLYHKVRDTYIFHHMKDAIINGIPDSDGNRVKPVGGAAKAENLVLVPEMSTPKRVGISVSQTYAQSWNDTHSELWLENNDLFNPPEMWDRDPTIIEPSMASYTDTYYIPNPENPGTQKEPNMLEVKIGEKVVMYNPYGSLLAYCVKRRRITDLALPGGDVDNQLSGSVDPSEFGVKFDMNLGKCIFTRDFCDRYGMEYVESDNDCKLRPGQEVAELIFGPTLTRGTIRTYQEKVLDNLNSDDPARVALGVFYTVNPLALAVTAVGERVWDNIDRTIAKSSRLASVRSCKSFGSGLVSSGTDCWKNTLPKKSNIPTPKSCDDFSEKYGKGLRDDGISCWRDTLIKKSSPANLIGCEGKPLRDNATGKLTGKYEWDEEYEDYGGLKDDKVGSCWLHAKTRGGASIPGCGSGFENHGICYPRCSDGYQGAGPLCVQKSCGEGKLKRGLICYEDCRDTDYDINRSLLECAKCSDGFKRDLWGTGLGCEKGSGFNWQWKPQQARTRGQGGLNTTIRSPKTPNPFPTECDSSGKHPSFSLGLCYENCPKNENNESVYNGVGPTCWPKAKVGIKKNIGDRLKCGPSQWQPDKCRYINTAYDGNTFTDKDGTKVDRNIAVRKVIEMLRDRGGVSERYVINRLEADRRIYDSKFKDEIDYLLDCPKLRKNIAGVCWDECPPKDYNDVEYIDHGVLCQPKSKGSATRPLDLGGVEVPHWDRVGPCGKSSYQPIECEDIENNRIDETVTRLRSVGETDLADKLSTEGFTDANKPDIEAKLDCPKMRTNLWGVCWDTCPPANLSPANKDVLISSNADMNAKKIEYDTVQKQYDAWKTVLQGYGSPEHVPVEILNIVEMVNGTPVTLKMKYDSMTFEEHVNEYDRLGVRLNDARQAFEDAETKYNSELDRFRRDLDFGYADLGAICHPLGTNQGPGKGEETTTAEISAGYGKLLDTQLNPGPGIKVPLQQRYYCNDDEKLWGGRCWSKCPDGYRDDGATCYRV